jgi:hypothetical protein
VLEPSRGRRFRLAAQRAFINWESRFRPAGVIPPFFTAGVALVPAFILAQRALAAVASLARVAAGIGWRPPLAVAEVAREPARIEERRFCRVSICRRIETASCRASTDISIHHAPISAAADGHELKFCMQRNTQRAATRFFVAATKPSNKWSLVALIEAGFTQRFHR